MHATQGAKKLLWLLAAAALVVGSIPGASALAGGASKPNVPAVMNVKQPAVSGKPGLTNMAYLPLMTSGFPARTPFGFESLVSLRNSQLMDRGLRLGASWARVGHMVAWNQLQPVEDGPIQWDLLADLDNILRKFNSGNITAVVMVTDYPEWALKPDARQDGQFTSCGPIRADKLDKFALFMGALAEHYSTPEFNVHHWEMGNEPDVDPDLVPPNTVFGCWGDIDDPFYGGRAYGDMLKAIAPAMRAADPAVKIWIGGLLLGQPTMVNPADGHQELFFQGILEAGAGDSFDIVAYHWYATYWNQRVDYDNYARNAWTDRGGGTLGKVRFLRQTMQAYGIDKPVFLNETALSCPDDNLRVTWCTPPDAAFYQAQSDYLVRTFARGLSEGIMGFSWFTLNGPGWRNSGLLKRDSAPLPVYDTYRQMANRLHDATFVGVLDYGTGLEGYTFQRGARQTQVVWAKMDETLTFTLPQAGFVAAYNLDGTAYTPTVSGADYQFSVGFSPIYIVVQP